MIRRGLVLMGFAAACVLSACVPGADAPGTHAGGMPSRDDGAMMMRGHG